MNNVDSMDTWLYTWYEARKRSIVCVAPVVQLVVSKPSDTLGREFESR